MTSLTSSASEIRIGSLFSGSGTLDLAALQVFPGSRLAWHADNDPAAGRVLARHWPDVSNLGDVTEIDWRTVEPVDVICGGFPCQDVSLAGRRAGLGEGTRSGLWSHMAAAIVALDPRYVLIENVEGLLSAYAVRGMESAPDALGGHRHRPTVRAAGAVLGALATLGFDAEWTSLRASDVGGCHRRRRVFILAYSADSHRRRPQRTGRPTRAYPTGAAPRRRRRLAAGHGDPDLSLLPTPSVADATGGHVTRSGARADELLLGGLARAHADGALLPTPRASDGTKGSPNQRGSGGDLMLPSAVYALASDSHGTGGLDLRTVIRDVSAELLPTPTASDGTGGGQHPDQREGHTRQLIDYALAYGSPRWGAYQYAVTRQERLTRPAPSPTEPNKNGKPRLSAAFAEWMMMMPPGWITDPEIGLSRIEQLRIIGNAVVTPCAVAAYRHLMARDPIGVSA
ncbi:DNA cytosine methyltransferase [Nocardia altamirensis]|uniref:DNA cytosine methyltransferase n=1 Tax=Nocardia altamirensis TaxID=472158 RepID=UPI00083FFC92|nr:DNA cytosine methyltransferase [Nocardia altamirensis]